MLENIEIEEDGLLVPKEQEKINFCHFWKNDQLFFEDLTDVQLLHLIGLLEFDVYFENGEFRVVDLQGVNLGNIESERFGTIIDICVRLEHYFEDYYQLACDDDNEQEQCDVLYGSFYIRSGVVERVVAFKKREQAEAEALRIANEVASIGSFSTYDELEEFMEDNCTEEDVFVMEINVENGGE